MIARVTLLLVVVVAALAGLWAPGVQRPGWLEGISDQTRPPWVAGLAAMATKALGIEAPKARAPAPPAATGRVLPPAPVQVAVAKRETLPIRLDGIGNVQARSTIAVKSRIDGQVNEAFIKEGQMVKKGDPLFRIDPRAYEAQLRQAEANLARDVANYEKARADYGRSSDLLDKGFAARSKFDDAKAALGALEATITSDQAAIEVAKVNLDYTMIRSPIDGQVGTILVTAGNIVKANDTQAMLVITEIDPIYVAFAVPEQYIGQLRERMSSGTLQVDVWAPGQKNKSVAGDLFFVNNVVDSSTGTIMLMARFANATQTLVAGQYVEASLRLSSVADVVSVPARAIQIGQKGTFVYVVKPDNTVEFRLVKVGPAVDDVIVIQSGLDSGQTVVTDGQLRLFPGARVIPGGVTGTKTKEQS